MAGSVGATFVFAGTADEQEVVLATFSSYGLDCTVGEPPSGTQRGLTEVVDNVVAGIVVVGAEAIIRQAFREIRKRTTNSKLTRTADPDEGGEHHAL